MHIIANGGMFSPSYVAGLKPLTCRRLFCPLCTRCLDQQRYSLDSLFFARSGSYQVEDWPCVFSCNFPGKIFSPRCFSDPHVILASAIPLAHFAIRSQRHYCPSSHGMTLQHTSTAVYDAVNTWGEKTADSAEENAGEPRELKCTPGACRVFCSIILSRVTVPAPQLGRQTSQSPSSILYHEVYNLSQFQRRLPDEC
jgi:hypothetical protein